jgi:hypothetical protein
MGDFVKVSGKGLRTNSFTIECYPGTAEHLKNVTSDSEPFDGDPSRFRLGVEARRLKWAHEYDPYFSLSIARVDPLPTARGGLRLFLEASENPVLVS